MICCVRYGLRQSRGGSRVIEMRRTQISFGDGLITEEVSDLRESWMIHADAVHRECPLSAPEHLQGGPEQGASLE